jgi:hypothetical protein
VSGRHDNHGLVYWDDLIRRWRRDTRTLDPATLRAAGGHVAVLPSPRQRRRRGLNPALLWFTTLVLGLAASLLASQGILAALLALVLAAPLIIWGDRLVALSGLLIGFGALWSAGMARQLAASARLDEYGFWVALGAIPLVVGLGLLVIVLWRRRRGRRRG